MLAHWLQRVARVEADEVRPVAVAFLLFFCVLCGYFMLRPVRETIGTVLGESEVEKLFAMTFFASVAVIPLYGLACSRLPRAVVLASVYAIFGGSLHPNRGDVCGSYRRDHHGGVLDYEETQRCRLHRRAHVVEGELGDRAQDEVEQ